MRESIGGAQVLLIMLTILIVIIVVLSASVGYTKAFKARNAILNIVQKYAKYGDSATAVLSSGAEKEIDEILTNMGYKASIGSSRDCPDRGQEDVVKGLNYNYCVYHFVDEGTGTQHYGIQTYMYFELPIFGRNDRFSFPIYADTYLFREYGGQDI